MFLNRKSVCLIGFVLTIFSVGALAADRPSSSRTTFQIQVGLDGEIYPALANYASLQAQSDRRFGVITVTISNPTANATREKVSVQVLGWSDQETQVADLAPGTSQTLTFAPSFLPRFYRNHEIVAATTQVSVADMDGHNVFEATTPVRLRSSEDMYWGPGFKYAAFIASWVTPHDPLVEAVLAKAKLYTADHRLPGYEDWKGAGEQELETYNEAKAIYTALQRMGLSYVKSSMTLGGHSEYSERVRMPQVSLNETSMNCIDAAVMYSSLFENLGMDAKVIIVPGHAYVGVRVAAKSSKFLLIDVALTGRVPFEAAVASAEKGMARQQPSSVIQVVIPEARSAGIYPMPEGREDPFVRSSQTTLAGHP
ncbi:MAG TPA: hypothetical protein VKE93_07395 [Candidatus Angelobacter sp.]|nr:hypothetical protein [Candidatus Angelobacter sp.]